MANFDQIQSWFLNHPYGRYILNNEMVFYHNVTSRVFGYYALQLNLPKIKFLENNRIANKYIINSSLRTKLFFLPFEENTIDLIIFPHVLEFYMDYYNILKECFRVLVPNGKIVLSTFNKFSLLNLTKNKFEELKLAKFASLNTLKNQLHDLNFVIDSGKFLCYTPPIMNQKSFTGYATLDKIGSRWLPTMANVFSLVAHKNVFNTKLITPKNSLFHINTPLTDLNSIKHARI